MGPSGSKMDYHGIILHGFDTKNTFLTSISVKTITFVFTIPRAMKKHATLQITKTRGIVTRKCHILKFSALNGGGRCYITLSLAG